MRWPALSLLSATAGAVKRVPMDDPAIVYSPFNWGVAGGSAKTINAGAYFRVLFDGATCQLATDTAASAGPYSQFYASVDGGPFVRHTLSPGDPTFAVAVGPSTASRHLLEVVVKSTTQSAARWAPQSTAVVFTGLLVDDGAAVAAPPRQPFNILVYGDSITEGCFANGFKGFENDTDMNDATKDYAWLLSRHLPAEVGVVAFGGAAVTHTGNGGVPRLPDSYASLWGGAPRSFAAPAPDVVVYNMGTNDQGDITAPLLSVIEGVRAAAPAARQLALVPFYQGHRAEVEAAAAAAGGGASAGDTAGWFDPADGSDGIHPYGYAHVALLAPRLARLVYPLLPSAPPPPAPPAQCAFTRTAGRCREPVPAANLRCMNGTAAEMEAACCADRRCASFAFAGGGGCLKRCSEQTRWVDGIDGYQRSDPGACPP